jgi:CheY-like chemotaxis protein
MPEAVCTCGFGEEYFTFEGNRSICTVCGGEVLGRQVTAAEEAPRERGKLVLVVDDQPFFRLRIRDILEQKHHQVLEAGEGVEAVRIISRALQAAVKQPGDRVSAVILDLNMPGLLDGFQTLGVIKALDEEVPVLVLTASPPTAELLKKLGQLRARKYLNKSSKNLEDLLIRNLGEL